MKIGLISQSCDRRTGIGRIVNALAGEFLEDGHEVVCSSQNFEGEDTRIIKRAIPRPTSSRALHKIIMRLFDPFDASTEVDIIHTFGVGRKADIVSTQSCHRAGVDLLRNKHLEDRLNLGLYDRVSLADEARLVTADSTRWIVAVSELVKSQIQEYYQVDGSRIVVIPNGVDTGLFQKLRKEVDKTQVRSTLHIPNGKFVLLFVGNEFGRKGLRTVLQSLRAINDTDMYLLVVGEGDIKAYSALAAKLGIGQQVSFLGSVPSPETIYQAADVFVLPSFYEPFGIVILEAMAAGVPVIASRDCGAVGTMRNREDLLLLDDPSSAEELSKQIRTLRSDDNLRATLMKAGTNRAREFSWHDISGRMVDVYAGVVKSK